MWEKENLSMDGLTIQRGLKFITKDILCSRSRLGWALVLPLCLKMVNTELFSSLSLGVRELVTSIEFITLCLSAVWKHRRQLTRFNREARELKGR